MKRVLISLMLALAPVEAFSLEGADLELVETTRLQKHFKYAREVVSEFCQSNREVMAMTDLFLKRLEGVYNQGEGMIADDVHRILDGVAFAAKKHQYQKRKDVEQTPYIIHPIAVTDILLDIGHVRDPDILIAALLHDTIEDTGTLPEEINSYFGKRVEGFVCEVTDDKSLTQEERKKQQVLHAPYKSAGAAQIKLADKLNNLRDLIRSPVPGWSKERKDAYFKWAQSVIDALPWVNGALKHEVDETIKGYFSL
jgi:hypothetical protein